MKKITKYSLLSTCLGLLLAHPALALSVPKPDRCPSIDVLKYRELLNAQPDCDGMFVALQYDKYGTSIPWVFGMDFLPGKTVPEALENGKKLLPSISGTPQPEYIQFPSGAGVWGCKYNDITAKPGEHAVEVVTFSLDDADPTVILSQFKNCKNKRKG